MICSLVLFLMSFLFLCSSFSWREMKKKIEQYLSLACFNNTLFIFFNIKKYKKYKIYLTNNINKIFFFTKPNFLISLLATYALDLQAPRAILGWTLLVWGSRFLAIPGPTLSSGTSPRVTYSKSVPS